MWCRFGIRQSGYRIHQLSAIVAYMVIIIGIKYHQLSVALLECRIDRPFQAFLLLVLGTQLVNYELDTVILVTVDLHAILNFRQHAIDAYCQVTLLA